VDLLEAERGRSAGCVVNPGGLTHTSVVLADALRGFNGPVIEVHLSNILAREPFRRVSLSAEAAVAVISGLGLHGYVLAVEGLAKLIEDRPDSGSTA
jgi:3-dehydroquinate dehydratase-2